MKINLSIILSSVIFIGFLASCSSTKYMTDKDDSIDFTQFKTFHYHGWAEESNKILTPFDQGRIEKAFGIELDKRGLTLDQENGDLIITLYVVTEQKTRTTANTTTYGMGGYGYGGYGGYYGHGPAYGWGGPSSSHTTYSEYDYKVGTLVIDVYDAKEKKLIWESIATGTINEKTKGREERINSLVLRMMMNYPVKAAK